jgi:hypothetical protein
MNSITGLESSSPLGKQAKGNAMKDPRRLHWTCWPRLREGNLTHFGKELKLSGSHVYKTQIKVQGEDASTKGF